MKRRSPLRRGAPPKRRTRPKPRNAERKAKEFARCYHSKERVEWVKSLPCWHCSALPSDNAHTEGDGAGRKARYDTILNLCRRHHQMFDLHEAPFNLERMREACRGAASALEARWVGQC